MRARPSVLAISLILAACGSTTLPTHTVATTVPSEKAEAKKPAADPTELPKLSEFAKGKQSAKGYFESFIDTDHAKFYIVLPKADPTGLSAELIYVEGLAHGLGSNPIGLDRGQLGETRFVRLRRIGRRLLVEQPNLGYRALTENVDETQSVANSFANSVLWAGDVVAEDESGRFVVDFTSFAVRDAHGVSRRLATSDEGVFALDAKRSTFDPTSVLSFPDNLEFEAILTFSGTKPGGEVRSVTPTPQSITLVQHHSFIRPPDDGYTPRSFDPRAGSFSIGFQDYAAALDEPIRKQWVARHRLEKKNPGPKPSRVVEPIIYYVDRGAPEPVRQALIDGASWWTAAFEKAGFIDAFRVELLPEGAHPLDVRYNVIQWVHRATRGWSYGGGVIDPRTGEFLKGHVSLGSLRVRQDRRIFEGLFGAENTGTGAANDPIELALARIRQLSAHEVGHTLGLRHNFAASTYADRASVMDYPAPRIKIGEDGQLDGSDAYGIGIGVWDEFSIEFAYGEFAGEQLESLVQTALVNGFRFGSDDDARPLGSAHPHAHLWDNGTDPIFTLEQTLEVRRIALENFGERSLASGQPLSLLQEAFVPVYFFHRYQMEAAVKLIGGVDYRPNIRGDGQPLAERLPAARQRAALDMVLACLDLEALDIDDDVLAALVPDTASQMGRDRERFRGQTNPTFDARTAATAAMDLTVQALLAAERCARLDEQARLETQALSLDEALEALVETAFDRRASTRRHRGLQKALQRVVVDRMIERAVADSSSDAVRSVVEDHLSRLHRRLVRRGEVAGNDAAHDAMLARDLDRFLHQRLWTKPEGWRSPPAPPGSPIGTSDWLSPLGCHSAQTAR